MFHSLLDFQSDMRYSYLFIFFNLTKCPKHLRNVFRLPPYIPSDTDPVKQVEPEGEKRLGVKERRRGRRERRSTGIVQLEGEV